jgi:hypothetical protein
VLIVNRIPIKAIWATALSADLDLGIPSPKNDRNVQFRDRSNRLHVEIEPAPWAPDITHQLNEAAAVGVLRLVVGDYTEPGVSAKDGPCANAVLIEVDLIAGWIFAISSAVGLPPMVVERNARFNALACPMFPRMGMPRSVDIDGVADALRWGHPLDGRTIFKDLAIVPPRSEVLLKTGSPPRIRPVTTEKRGQTYDSLSPQQLLEAQLAAIEASASRIPASGSFLSLSGGLDSRTALVALLTQGIRVPCVSMASSPHSLDARIARQFCAANDLSHRVIEFCHDYVERLPDLLKESAALTGGVAALSQTLDLYLYSQLESGSCIRISGHLGNQVGRGGVESIAATALTDEVFSPELRRALDARPLHPWFVPRMQRTGYASVLFEQEVHYWSVPNFMLGSSRALQVSPYADVNLIDMAKEVISRDRSFNYPTRRSIRRRDLRHRLIGPPREHSFQRTLLSRGAESSRNIPINWGWRAPGGWSVTGSAAALKFAVDAFASKMGRQYKPLKATMARLSRALGNPSELVSWPDMLLGPLRTQTHDILLSREVTESGLFDPKFLRRTLDEHFNAQTSHHATICRALEISLGLTSRT